MPVEHTKPSFYLLPPERLLPASSLPTWLGRIVKSYSEPDANFVPVDPTPFITQPVATTTITNANLDTLSQRNKSFAVALGTSLAQASHQSNDGGGLSFSGAEIVCVRLQDTDGVFDRLSEDPATRPQLARMLARGGNTGFMVTAALIWRDVTFTHVRERGGETSASVAVPVASIVGGTTGIVLPADVTDPSISGSQSLQTTAEISGASVGSHIFALQYKTVRRSFAQSFFGMRNSIKLKEQGPDLPSTCSFASERRTSATEEDDEDEDEDEVSSEEEVCDSDTEDGSGNGDQSKSGTQAGRVDDANVTLEMDEDDITWADTLEEDEEIERERADVMLGDEEMQFVF